MQERVMESSGRAERTDSPAQRAPQAQRAPFRGGEIVTLRGFDFRVMGVYVDGSDVVLRCLGPSKLGQNRAQRRRAKKRRRS